MRKKQFSLSTIVVLCFSLFFVFLADKNVLSEPNRQVLKILIVNVKNSITDSKNILREEGQENWAAAILTAVYGDQKVSHVDIYPVAETDNEKIKIANNSTLKLLNDFYVETDSDKIVVNIIMRYYGDTDKWWVEGNYPEEVSSLTNAAASEVKEIVKDFKQRYPQAKICGFALMTGSKVLLRSLENATVEFDKILLFVPPNDEAKNFASILEIHPNTKFYTIFDQDANFRIPIAVDDKTVGKIVKEW